jgi:uncharacterized membrane protein YdjX (TVP38/TMEM64 family)
MPSTAASNKFKISIILALIVFGFAGFWFRIPIWEKTTDLYHLFSDREQIRLLISSFGTNAPPIFILIQILQVIFAPVPGEATGFIGGYLFGTLPGFIYSSRDAAGIYLFQYRTDSGFLVEFYDWPFPG